MRYTAGIVDDEPKLRRVLINKIEKLFPNIEIIGEGSNVSEAIELIEDLEPDIIFLDISMPGGSGFDLLNHFDNIDFEIIFVTGFNEYALEALKLSAVDYVLKPVRDDDLVVAVHKALSKLDRSEKVKEYESLKQNMLSGSQQMEKIAIPSNNEYYLVFLKDIIRCEGWQKYTKVYMEDGETIVSSYNIGIYKELLEKYGFIMCHKSHVINKMHIKKYQKDGTLIMVDSSQVPVSRRKKDEFFQMIIKPD